MVLHLLRASIARSVRVVDMVSLQASKQKMRHVDIVRGADINHLQVRRSALYVLLVPIAMHKEVKQLFLVPLVVLLMKESKYSALLVLLAGTYPYSILSPSLPLSITITRILTIPFLLSILYSSSSLLTLPYPITIPINNTGTPIHEDGPYLGAVYWKFLI